MKLAWKIKHNYNCLKILKVTVSPNIRACQHVLDVMFRHGKSREAFRRQKEKENKNRNNKNNKSYVIETDKRNIFFKFIIRHQIWNGPINMLLHNAVLTRIWHVYKMYNMKRSMACNVNVLK